MYVALLKCAEMSWAVLQSCVIAKIAFVIMVENVFKVGDTISEDGSQVHLSQHRMQILCFLLSHTLDLKKIYAGEC